MRNKKDLRLLERKVVEARRALALVESRVAAVRGQPLDEPLRMMFSASQLALKDAEQRLARFKGTRR